MYNFGCNCACAKSDVTVHSNMTHVLQMKDNWTSREKIGKNDSSQNPPKMCTNDCHQSIIFTPENHRGASARRHYVAYVQYIYYCHTHFWTLFWRHDFSPSLTFVRLPIEWLHCIWAEYERENELHWNKTILLAIASRCLGQTTCEY